MEKKIKPSINQDKEIDDEPKVEIGKQPDVTLVKAQSSVSIETDSKGTKKYSIKVYNDDPDKAAEKALLIAGKIEERLNEKGE